MCDALGEENNGTTIAAMNLIRSLKAKGHEVRVVCPDAGRAEREGFFVVPAYDFGPFSGYVARNGVTLAKPDRGVLLRALRGADAVHAMFPFPLGSAAAKMAHRLEIPLTAGFHCQAENLTAHFRLMNFPPANRLAYRLFYRSLYRYCDCIHYPSQFICDVFEREVGPTRHRVISNGVSPLFCPGGGEKPAGMEGRFVILFTGRYSREKSHRVLIDAAARSRHREKLQLVFAGEGPEEERLRRYAAKRSILPPVMRFFSRPELVRVQRCADLYVHPAEIEIEAIACLEAIACGNVPVISDSPRSAARSFALTDKNLFACNDPGDLARKIDFWIGHPAERKACGERYLRYAERFRLDQCMDEMEAMILDTIREKAEAGRKSPRA